MCREKTNGSAESSKFEVSSCDNSTAEGSSNSSVGEQEATSSTDGFSVEEPTVVQKEPTTTMMLRNLPNKYTREMLIAEFEEAGVMRDIDFLYLPIDLRQCVNVGYCFVNFVSEPAVERFRSKFEGKKLKFIRSSKVLSLAKGAIQGLAPNIEHYRNRAVVKLPPKCQPLVFENGVPYPFPKPTVAPAEFKKGKPDKKGVSTKLVDGRPPNGASGMGMSKMLNKVYHNYPLRN
jgi:hypothetical protein